MSDDMVKYYSDRAKEYEEIYAWSTTISTGVAGGVMILLAMMLLIKGVRPLMNEIDISLG